MTIDEAIEQETFKARIDKIRANKKATVLFLLIILIC